MVDVFLVICIVVAFAIMIVAGVYFIVYYQHPDDKNEAWVPKIVVLLGLCLAGGTVLGLPLDVGNNSTNPGALLSFCLIIVRAVVFNRTLYVSLSYTFARC